MQDRTRRLGNMKNGSADVKGHKWFKEVNWDDVYQRKLKVTEMLFNNLLRLIAVKKGIVPFR